MPWTLHPDRPIYLQLVEQIRLKIVSGEYPPGGKLASVRDLAGDAAVNPNTMQKALTELERTGLIYAQRTSGRFITEDREKISQVRQQLAAGQIADFFGQMEQLGYSRAEALALVQSINEEMKQ
ncbi:MAG: GntR family transcriptional regulator [Eubacteriales bacterium]|nr:GntR family transcriptional regulator [Eubacteriales bacterium]